MADSRPEPVVDSHQTVTLTSDVTDDHEDYDTASLVLTDELAHDDVNDNIETEDSRSTVTVSDGNVLVGNMSAITVSAENMSTATVSADNVSAGDLPLENIAADTVSAGNVLAATLLAVTAEHTELSVTCDVTSSASATTVTSQTSRSSPSKSDAKSMPTSVVGAQQSTLAESTLGSENVLDQLSVVSCCSVVVPSSKSVDSSSSVPSSLSSSSAAVKPVVSEATHTRSKLTTTSTSKMAPLAKKGLTHLLNSSSALFHRKRQLRTDSSTPSLCVGYSGSSVSLASLQTESDSLSVSSAETDIKSQTTDCQNADEDVMPVVCDDVMFLMVKDDFCQKPADSSPVDRTEEPLSSSCKDSCLSSKTSYVPSGEVADKTDKDTADTVSLRSRQVASTSVCL